MNQAPKNPSDYVIMQSDPADGKLKIVGRAWRKEGKSGTFLSLSIGDKDNRQSYLMFKNDKQKAPAPRSGPPKQMPERYKPPVNNTLPDDSLDDL